MKKIRTCKICKVEIKGRSDKMFCSATCKSYYHNQLKKVTKDVTQKTDAILHRNRSILLELMGKNTRQKKILSTTLEKKNFKFNYCTGIYTNAKGKQYYIVYDFAWMKFSSGEILIVRRNIN